MEEIITKLIEGKSPEEITEINLDNCGPPIKLQQLQQFTNLEFLSLRNVKITTLKNFPKLPKLKKLDLSSNNITSSLFLLNGCSQLTHLNLSNNKVKDVPAIKQLTKLKQLQSLLLVNCDITQVPYYRQKIFHYLKHLQDLDGENKSIADQESYPEEPKPPKMDASPQKKRKAKGPESIAKKLKENSDKNSLMLLNEFHPGLKYIVESMFGPPHQQEFMVSVDVNGIRYTGQGRSKQQAKHVAAENALVSMGRYVKQEPVEQDFTMDLDEHISFDSSNGISKPAVQTPKKEKINPQEKNPSMLLHEYRSDLVYKPGPEDSVNPSRRFSLIVEVDGETFKGYGPSKKTAKQAVARAVLAAKYKLNFNAPFLADSGQAAEGSLFPQSVADNIGQSVMNAFKDIMVGNVEHSKWKVIAGIVMTKTEDMLDPVVIGLATGTKCINGEFISIIGTTLNDCHAEIITRRCLKDFLYTNLELHLEGEGDQSIFMRKDTGGFVLRPGIKFHLYISTAPCGDARIFCPHEDDTSQDRHPNRLSRGVLRTKIESGEGTIPVKSGQSVQTFDAILPGQERLLTMSCSDKIARWNVLGLQGSLLSHFVEPIYLESIVLGALFNANHMNRALVTRFESNLQDLPSGYHVNKLKMCCVSSREVRQLVKSPNFSVNWTTGQGRAEVVNATTGKTTTSSASRLCKRSFFQRFVNIYDRLPHTGDYSPANPPLYSVYKNSIKPYQEAKEALVKAFAAAGLGAWVKKPLELNDFELVF